MAHGRGFRHLRGDAAQQHAGEMLFRSAGFLDVVGRIEIGASACTASSTRPRPRRLRPSCAHRRSPTPKKTSRTSSSELPSAVRAPQVRPWHSRRAGGQLGKAVARVRSPPAPESRVSTSPADRRLEQPLEKVVRLDPAAAASSQRSRFAAERKQAGRQFGRRVGKGDANRRWCRGCGSPDARYAAERARSAAHVSRCRPNAQLPRGAPTRRSRRCRSSAMPSSPAIPLISISTRRDSRMLSVAIRLWPPASRSRLAMLAKSSIASSTERAFA